MVEPNQPQQSQQLYAGRLRDLDPGRLQVDGWCEAFDEATNKAVTVAAEPMARNPGLAGLANVEHAHLARVVAVIEHDDRWLVITDAPRGTKLSTRVKEIGRKHAVDAVRTALRVADALGHLHDAGVVHGRVNPENVLLALEHATEPALLYAAPSSQEYCRPESRPHSAEADQPLDARDDTWAATAILYFMLTGTPPPIHGVGSVGELEGLSIDDALLCQLLVHGLARDTSQRAKDLTSLRRELARWFVSHAADEPIALGNVSHKPPPLPPSVSPKPRRSLLPRRSSGAPAAESEPVHSAHPPVPDPRSGWLRSLPLAMAAAVIGIGAAWGLSRAMKPNKVPVAVRVTSPTLSSSPEPSASVQPIDLAEVPVTGKEKEEAAGDPTASCAKGYLRDGTLTKFAQLDSICKETELPRALGALRVAFASSAGPTPQNIARFDSLGWYSLPLLSALRQACCTDPAA
ncbi:MAG TPA: protein kinase, partial [Polyangiaceae bacterium]